MVLWVLLALLTGAAVLTVLWPLSNAAAVEPDAGGDVGFYRDQLAEIGRDQERGVLGPAEAEAARIESSRRLLRAAAAVRAPVDATSEPALRRRRAASTLALSVVPLVGLALYGGLGSPHLPAQPSEARLKSPSARPDIAAALNKIEEHLAAQPGDVRGWDVIAPIYLRSGRFEDAARAFDQARRLGGDTLERLLGHGEALVSAGGGLLNAEARDIFRRAVAMDSSSPPARYYLSLASEQDGDHDRARDGYRALLADAKPEAPWAALVRTRLSRLEGGTREPVATLPPEAVSPEISAMVTGLDERLTANGGTEAEWSRLVRSFVVLGRRDDAMERLGRAKAALAGEADALTRLDHLAGEIGLRREAARQ